MEKNMNEEEFDKYNEELLNTVLKFNELFSDYVKEMDPVLWNKAREYAKDFSKNESISLEEESEKTPEKILSTLQRQTIFLKLTASYIQNISNEYQEFVMENIKLSTEDIKSKWLKKNKDNNYTEKDPFGAEKDLDLFISCDHRFSFDKFDDSDWMDYIYILINCTKDINFVKRFKKIFEEHHTEDNKELHNYYRACMGAYAAQIRMLQKLENKEEQDDTE
jgi:hypothetical protein